MLQRLPRLARQCDSHRDHASRLRGDLPARCRLATSAMENQIDEHGQRLIWLPRDVLDRLRSLRGPGEDYSDVILRGGGRRRVMAKTNDIARLIVDEFEAIEDYRLKGSRPHRRQDRADGSGPCWRGACDEASPVCSGQNPNTTQNKNHGGTYKKLTPKEQLSSRRKPATHWLVVLF